MRTNIIKLKMKQIYTLAKKNIKIYYMEPPVLIFGVLFPAFLFLAFYQGRSLSPQKFIPGLVAIIFFFGGSSVGPYITPWETNTKTLERVLSTPTSVMMLILGDIMSGVLFGISLSILILILGVVIFHITIQNIALTLLAIIISAFCFASLGSLFSALPTDKPSNVMMISNLIRLPVIFISGVFVPIGELPGVAQFLAPFSPVTYVTDLMRYLLGNAHYFSVIRNFISLIIFSIVIFVLALFFHKKTMLKRI